MAFNKDRFKQSVVESATVDRHLRTPEGEHFGTITKYDVEGGGGEKPWLRLDLTMEGKFFPNQAEARERRFGMMLNLKDGVQEETMTLADVDPDRNVAYGQLRTAVGGNSAGKAFHLDSLLGKGIHFIIKHRGQKDAQGEPKVDPSTGEQMVNEVITGVRRG